ncbi:hypothetical protein GQR58_020277 [Nymphon striatum]|nr:hypothetical protein GQR58_020277 [Nymphon striatum]
MGGADGLRKVAIVVIKFSLSCKTSTSSSVVSRSPYKLFGYTNYNESSIIANLINNFDHTKNYGNPPMSSSNMAGEPYLSSYYPSLPFPYGMGGTAAAGPSEGTAWSNGDQMTYLGGYNTGYDSFHT